MNSFLVSHPFGNPNSYDAAVAFLERGELQSFHTCLFRPWGSHYRQDARIPLRVVRTHPLRETVRLAMTLSPIARFSGRQQWFIDWASYAFDRSVSESVTNRLRAVYCYEDCALDTFKASGRLGVKKVYELPLGYYAHLHAMLATELKRDRTLAPMLQTVKEPAEKLRRKDEELRLADIVVCASSFARESILRYVDNGPAVKLIPYGAPVELEPKRWSDDNGRGPLKLLFVGRLDPRKGLHYLFEGLSKLPAESYELSLAGRWVPGFRAWLNVRYPIRFRDLGQVAHSQLADVYRAHDTLVFPSLAEGYGLVISEAMACGIPVIATERTAAADLITHGQNGFITRAGDPDDLRKVLAEVVAARSRLAGIGLQARRTAEALPWSGYRERLASELLPLVGAHASAGKPALACSSAAD